jgi:hypothetical protein
MTDETAGQDNTDATTDQPTGAAQEGDETTLEGGDQAATGKQDGEGGEGSTPEVPDTYAFNVPDGMEIDQAFADSVSPVFKELGLSQEQADKLVSAYAERMGAQQQSVTDAYQKQLDEWTTELKSDQEVGGDAFEQNAGIAAKAIKQFGSDELKALLDETGIGSNPAMFKFALAVGKTLGEDEPGSGDAANQPSTIEDEMYPNEAKRA